MSSWLKRFRLRHLWHWMHRIRARLFRGMGHFWQNVMSLTGDDRLNLTKSFDYFDNRHFREHAHCLDNGINYRWLAYENKNLKKYWDRYRKELDAEITKPIAAGQLECHVFPLTSERAARIPFRITMFGERICLCGEERAPNTYQHGVDTIAVQPVGQHEKAFKKMWDALDGLFRECPTIEEWLAWIERPYPTPEDKAPWSDKEKLFLTMHKDLQAAFLQPLTENYSRDIPLRYAEGNLHVTMISLLIAALALLLSAVVPVADLLSRWFHR
jgi:hypothetical protein